MTVVEAIRGVMAVTNLAQQLEPDEEFFVRFRNAVRTVGGETVQTSLQNVYEHNYGYSFEPVTEVVQGVILYQQVADTPYELDDDIGKYKFIMDTPLKEAVVREIAAGLDKQNAKIHIARMWAIIRTHNDRNGINVVRAASRKRSTIGDYFV